MCKYKISDLKIGDKIGIYIHRTDGGASMGPSVEGNPEYYRHVIFGGHIYNNNHGQGYYLDTLEPIGIPLSDSCIFEVIKGGAIEQMKQIMLKQAKQIGRWAISRFVEEYNEFPIVMGSRVLINGYSNDYGYKVLNKKLGIKNNHKVLSSKELELIDYQNGIITVKCLNTNKTAITGMQAIEKVYEV